MIRASLRALTLAAVFVAAHVAVSPAQAQRADCEKLKDAHAYNNCIAAAGPASRAGSGAASRSRAQAAQQRSSSRRAVRSAPVVRGAVSVRRLPNGRMRMEIPTGRRR